jgi:hypothetical protein
MAKRTKQFEIREAVRGSFVGARGRVRYDLEAGTVSEQDVDPEVLARLMATGAAGPAKVSTPAESEESA